MYFFIVLSRGNILLWKRFYYINFYLAIKAAILFAMEEGFSTASDKVREMGFGAGMGLPNIKKNSDEMHLTSIPGKGTTLELMVNF